MQRRTTTALIVTVLLMTVAPGGAIAAGASVSSGPTPLQQSANETSSSETGNSSVNVATGAQLATIVASVETEIRTDYEATAFEIEIKSEADEERAESIADRHEELRERAEDVREEYRDATEAYQEGDITRDEYAQRVATLNARAESVATSLEQLENRTAELSNETRTRAGVNVSEVRSLATSLDDVRGAGPSALLDRFTGAESGDVEIEASNGVSLEVESDDGKIVREFERDHEGGANVSINHSEAAAIAIDHLTDRENDWTIVRSEIDRDDGVYSFELRLDGANETGEAEVSVDAGSGSVFELEEEIEPRGDDSDEREDGPEHGDETENETEFEDDENETESENRTVQVDRSTAIDNARAELTEYEPSWNLDSVELDVDDAVYDVEFVFENDTTSGEVDVEVDGVSGAIMDYDEEIEDESDDSSDTTETETEDDDSDDDDSDDDSDDDTTETETDDD